MMTDTEAEGTLSQRPKKASSFGLKVARILDDIWALYNVPGVERVDFSRNDIVEVNIGKTLATFDFDELTQLVVRCHDACIRLSVSACNMRYLKLQFHPRERDGVMWARHPTMEQAIERVRTRNYFRMEHAAPSTAPNGTLTSDAVGQPTSDTSGEIPRAPESSSSSS